MLGLFLDPLKGTNKAIVSFEGLMFFDSLFSDFDHLVFLVVASACLLMFLISVALHHFRHLFGRKNHNEPVHLGITETRTRFSFGFVKFDRSSTAC